MHIENVLGLFHSLIHYLVTRDSFLVAGVFIYTTLVVVSVLIFYLLKYLGVFKIKDVKVNEELAEADTDFYRKSVNFSSLPAISPNKKS